MANYFTQGLILFTCLMVAPGCTDNSSAPHSSIDEVQVDPQLHQHAGDFLATLASRSGQQQAETLIRAKALATAVTAFLKQPAAATQNTARLAWHKTHAAWVDNQLAFFRNNLNAIADLEGLADTQTLSQVLFRVDAWPILPGFLDALPEYPDSGIISDLTLSITPETLTLQHGITDDEEVALGLHALEYFLFARPLEDFAPASPAKAREIQTAPDADTMETQNAIRGDPDALPVASAPQKNQRRREALGVIAAILVKDLEALSRLLPMQFEDSDPERATAIVHLFMIHTVERMRVAFRESHLLFEGDLGHARFSATSMDVLNRELEALHLATLADKNFLALIASGNPDVLSNYRTSLNQALDITRDPTGTETSLARLPLLLSAILHQLESFEQTLKYQLGAGSRLA